MVHEQTVIEYESGQLVAFRVVIDGVRVRIRGNVLASIAQQGQLPDDPADVGEWISDRLESARIPRRGITRIAPRGEVVLKSLSLPNAGLVDAGELATMVRLQLTRQLTMSVEGTAIDYHTPATDSRSSPSVDGMCTVIAGAIPTERVKWWERATHAGRLGVAHTRLKAFGIAEVVGTLPRAGEQTVLAIAFGPGSTEFVFVEAGEVVSTRAVEMIMPEVGASEQVRSQFMDKLTLEARRALLAHRGPRGVNEPALVAVVGEGELVSAVGQACEKALGIKWAQIGIDALGPKGAVDFPAEMDERTRTFAIPLVACIAAPLQNRRGLDFTQPRKLPNPAARLRQVALAGVFAAILVAGLAYVIGQQATAKRKATLAVYAQRETRLREQLLQAQIADARLRHISMAHEAHADWLAHMALIADMLPNRSLVRLDELSGTIETRVAYAPSGSYLGGKWSRNARATFTLTGAMTDADADALLRERVLSSRIYGIQLPGPDTQDRFALRIIAEDATKLTSSATRAKGQLPESTSSAKPAGLQGGGS